MFPNTLCGDNILMAHQKYRIIVAFAFPIIEQISVNFGFFEVFMYKRKKFFQNFMKAAEFFRFINTRMRSRVILDHRRQFFGKAKRLIFVFICLIF